MRHIRPLHLLRTTLIVLSTAFSPLTAAADNYPSKPIRIVVGPAGGGTDLAARLIGKKMKEQWGQPVVVENRGGAGGTVVMEIVAKSAPDGYSLVLVYGSFFIAPSVYANLRFDSMNDFAPVIQLFNSPIMISVHPGVATRSLKELVTLAKSKPNQLTYATPGVGSGSHLAGELLNHMSGIKLNHVPYKGTGPAMVDTLGGHINILMTAVQNTIPHIRSGKLIPIGTTALKRTNVLPDVPAIAESLPGFEVISAYGLLAPAKTPKTIVNKLNQVINTAILDPEFKKTFEQDGVEMIGGSPERFEKNFSAYMKHYANLVQIAGIKKE
jgi:tripartite-type tricarboxylate transporter receptor subunit TctC